MNTWAGIWDSLPWALARWLSHHLASLPLPLGVPSSTRHWHLAMPDCPKPICLCTLWAAGWQEAKLVARDNGCTELWATSWGGQEKWQGIRNQHCPAVSLHSPQLRISLPSTNTIPSQIRGLPFFRGGKQVMGCPEEAIWPASQSWSGWKAWFSAPCSLSNCAQHNSLLKRVPS